MSNKPTKITPILLLPLLLVSLASAVSSDDDTLAASQSLAANQTLVSAAKTFELGFFAAGEDLYLGIWYYNISVKTVVWVANRDAPLWSSSATLTLHPAGHILLTEPGDADPIWSSPLSPTTNPLLQLLDNGNLVVRSADDPHNYSWQSFDHPTDTLLPGQKLGWDNKTGIDRYLTSWRSQNDPSTGNYSFRMNRTGDPELYLLNSGTDRIYRSGPWVGLRFSGVPEMKPGSDLNFTFVSEPDEVYYSYVLLDESAIFRLVVHWTGILNRYLWVPDRKTWSIFWNAPKDQCDVYALCGPYGVCDSNHVAVCECSHGFEPRNPGAWGLRIWSDGCERQVGLECGSDGFGVVRNVKLPESRVAEVARGMTLAECGAACRRDCGCTAYGNREVVAGVGTGCVMWRGELVDMRIYTEGGQDLYIRLAASDIGATAADTDSSNSKSKNVSIGVGVSALAALVVVSAVCCFACKKNRAPSEKGLGGMRSGPIERSHDILLSGTIASSKRDMSNDNITDDLELPLYDFNAMVKATDNFSEENKLGQGGFGRVYKGVLGEGEEVAVKRLSKESGQGAEEFMNEVKLIAKLQHRNLVRLLGCCIEKDEKMLLYEYLHNKSLDSVLFHKERCFLLNWNKRFNIICGIARGLLYLHHDSRLRIVHRDLKASNVLLDHDMNPKISDFGMARIFGGDETESSNTRRIVGTYGYMSPEYAMDGVFSIKSDVFSFGVLVLEIVTGKKNRGFYKQSDELNLLGYAWKMWKERRGTELADGSMGESYSAEEVLRCIHVGLLCVQERPEERPTMSTVLTLLSSESATLPRPKLPGFCMGWKPNETDWSMCGQDESFTVNQVTVTMLDGR